MSNEGISREELTKKRTPSELLSWVKWKREQIASTEEGERTLILHEGLAKQFEEEVYPLAIFGQRKFGNTDQILMQPIIGNQSYDAVITDLSSKPASESYIEITQAHEGENDYLRSCVLAQQGIVPMHGPVTKTGTKKTGRKISTPFTAANADEVATKELKKIVDAVKGKAGKDYPINTSLLIVFDDGLSFRLAVDDRYLDTFVKENILKLDLRFSTLYLVGWQNVFREFNLAKRP